jgi:hypothetical protein
VTARRVRPKRLVASACVAGGALLSLAACGGGGGDVAVNGATDGTVPAAAVRVYVAAVEKVRLPVNDLLEGADPILNALHEHRIMPAQASSRMDRLERGFARYLLAAQQIDPSNSQLKTINRPYADTYFYEDAYLATLASDLREGDFDNLPNTQDAQRLAIIKWRTQLEAIAARSGVTLPADLQQAGVKSPLVRAGTAENHPR